MLKDKKILNVSIQSTTPTLVANRFLFKLSIDYKSQKIFLNICDKNMKLLEESTYWEFKQIQEKLERKLSFLAYIKA